jgi:hypothetical protein
MRFSFLTLCLILLTAFQLGFSDTDWQVESGSAVADANGFSITGSGVVSKTYSLNFTDDPLLIYELQGYDSADWNVALSHVDGSGEANPRGALVLEDIFYLDPRVVLSWSGQNDLKVTFTVNSGNLSLTDNGVEFFTPDLIYPAANTSVVSFIGPDEMPFQWPNIDGADEYTVEFWPVGDDGNVQSLTVSGICNARPATTLTPGQWGWRVVAKHNSQIIKTSYDYNFTQGTVPLQRASFGQVKLYLNNTAEVSRNEFAVSGVPFEKGKFFPGGNVSIKDINENPLAFQCDPLGFWPDGSIKWGLFTVDVNVAAESSAELTLNSETGILPNSSKMAYIDINDIVVDTGELTARVPLFGFDPFGDMIIANSYSRSVDTDIEVGAVLGASETDPVIVFAVDSAESESYIESNGHLRTVLISKGELIDSSNNVGFDFILRQIYFKDSKEVRLLLSLVCKTGTVVRGGTIPTVLLDYVKVRFGGIYADVVYFGSGEDMRYNREGGKLILDQMEYYMFEISTE